MVATLGEGGTLRLPKVKKELSGLHFDCDDHFITAVDDFLGSMTPTSKKKGPFGRGV